MSKTILDKIRSAIPFDNPAYPPEMDYDVLARATESLVGIYKKLDENSVVVNPLARLIVIQSELLAMDEGYLFPAIQATASVAIFQPIKKDSRLAKDRYKIKALAEFDCLENIENLRAKDLPMAGSALSMIIGSADPDGRFFDQARKKLDDVMREASRKSLGAQLREKIVEEMMNVSEYGKSPQGPLKTGDKFADGIEQLFKVVRVYRLEVEKMRNAQENPQSPGAVVGPKQDAAPRP
ncbi:MAG: hypothetical protein PHY92_08515 [Alphaproteobacteria bacterium]|nr:hypothetical protein [Alphaproteobacteria bacterium]